MKKYMKLFLISMAVVGLAVTQVLGVSGNNVEAAPAKHSSTKLIIDLNVPQIKGQFKDNKIELHALRIYKDGHFEKAVNNLEWRSSNQRVASVSKAGKVTLSGRSGTTIITVKNGVLTDKITIRNSKKGAVITPTKDKKGKYNIIDNAIAKMTVKEKIGQMLMPDFRTWNGQNVTQMLPEIKQLVKDYHLGGVILFRENVETTEQTTKLVHDYQAAAEKYGLLMTIDQEGGIVTRLQSGTDMPGNMALGAARSEELTRKVSSAIGEELHSLGINMNLAPSLDVNNNPDNPVIGVRSFGEDPVLVANMGKAYIKGLQDTGVAATAKHFPGHGDTAVDSHLGLPEVPHDLERLKKVELYPFQQAMDAGIDAIMTAHVTFPKIDNTKAISKQDGTEISIPATLSEKVLTGLMREKMGYQGVIITDAMNMQAISSHFGPVDAAIRTVKAGTDIVLMPVGLKDAAEGLYSAVKTGEISEKRINQSVKRILTLKVNRGIIKAEEEKSIAEKVKNAQLVVGSATHKQIEKEAAAKSITLVKNEAALPLKATQKEKVVVIGSTYLTELETEIKKYHQNIQVISTTKPLTDEQLAGIQDAKTIILGTMTSTVSGRAPNSDQMKLANQLTSGQIPVIGIGIRNPYDVMAYPNVDAYLVQYGFRRASFEASAATIFGQNNPTGKLPITIYNSGGDVLYGFGHGLNY